MSAISCFRVIFLFPLMSGLIRSSSMSERKMDEKPTL